jgi:hypothetical protein
MKEQNEIHGLKNGDRVTVTGKIGPVLFQKAYGIVIIDKHELTLGIEFDDSQRGLHGFEGRGKDNHCYWVYRRCVTLINPTPVSSKDQFKPGDTFSALKEADAKLFIGCEVEAIDTADFRSGMAWIKGKLKGINSLSSVFPFIVTKNNTTHPYSFIRLTPASFEAPTEHYKQISSIRNALSQLIQDPDKTDIDHEAILVMVDRFREAMIKLKAEQTQSQ